MDPSRAGSNIGPHLPRYLPWNRGRAATHTLCQVRSYPPKNARRSGCHFATQTRPNVSGGCRHFYIICWALGWIIAGIKAG